MRLGICAVALILCFALAMPIRSQASGSSCGGAQSQASCGGQMARMPVRRVVSAIGSRICDRLGSVVNRARVRAASRGCGG